MSYQIKRGIRALENENIPLHLFNTTLQRPEAMCRWKVIKCDFKDINGVFSRSLIEQFCPWHLQLKIRVGTETPHAS